MKEYLLEINHPGQVHLFKHVYKQLVENGNQLVVTTKSNLQIEYLLNQYSIPFTIIGEKGASIRSKVFKQIVHTFNAYKLYRKHKFHLGFGTSVTNDLLSVFTKMKAIHFSDDDEHILSYITKYSYPFSDTIISPDSLSYQKFKKKCVQYAGTHELAYLHPNYFKPDIGVLEKNGISQQEPFFVLRFVALNAFHDSGHLGISLEQKRILINFLQTKGRVFITSENPIEKEFEQFRIPVPAEDIHSLLYYSKLFTGDSQTMTSEAGILGTPSIKCNTFAGKLSVPNELEEKYELCYAYTPEKFNDYLTHIKQMLQNENLEAEWTEKRQKFLADKIDVTAFIVWFLENYPESKHIMKTDPDFQYNFK